jgi:hypothetical protein
VEVISGPDQPLRRCTSVGGQSWEETCTVWEEGRRFAVTVDSAGYPYPLDAMGRLWQVDPHPEGSRVTMRFTYQARSSIGGALFALALRVGGPWAIRRIFDGWQRQLRAGTSRLRGGA